ncbi:condensation domain-containing protein [Prescottella defluvii]|nr:condensation domain-containing protein [Prescottella defluvii]
MLGVERVGRDDDFFDLGGNSLIATRVVARLGEALDARIPVRVLFDSSTVQALAAHVEQFGGRGRAGLVAGPRPDRVPLSFAQQRMWFLNRLHTMSAADNVPVALRLSGLLDRDALAAAVHDVFVRHESLRTVYPEIDGVGHQVIEPAARAPRLARFIVDSGDELLDRLEELTREPFDVTREIPVRAALYELSPTEHVLLLVVHHIAADGFSMLPLARDVMTAYTARSGGQAPGWKPLEVQYADYAVWQRNVLGAEDDPESVLSRQLAFWQDTLAGLPDQLDLPADRPRPEVASNRGAMHRFSIESGLRSSVEELARVHGATPFMVVHAALATLLSRLSGADDIAIGTPVAGRGEAALDDLVGMFVNTLVLRTEVDGAESFADLIARVRERDLAAYEHTDVPFERLVEVLDPVRSQARHPLFQVMLSFQNLDFVALELQGLSVSAVEAVAAAAKFDLQMTVTDSVGAAGEAAGWSVELVYATDLFDEQSMSAFGERFERVLTAVTTDPSHIVGDVNLLDSVERELLSEWSSAGTDRSGDSDDVTLVSMFEAQAARTPASVAVSFGDVALTYSDLDTRSNLLARHLVSLGVGPESLVAVALPRSADLVVALLAVSKAGGGYLPVDPSYPAERIQYMVSDASPICVVADTSVEIPVADDVPRVDLDAVELSEYAGTPLTDADRLAPLRSEHVAYVIYTSGSTGRPKGVMVPHRNVVRLFVNTENDYGFGGDDVWTMFHSYAFDFSVWELWGPLLYGGRLVVVDFLTSRSPDVFHALLVRSESRCSIRRPRRSTNWRRRIASPAPRSASSRCGT